MKSSKKEDYQKQKCLWLRKAKSRLNFVKNFVINICLTTKHIFFKIVKFIYSNFTIIIYSTLSILFLVLLIILVIKDRMGEVDTALKYILLPVYIYSSLFSGRIASKKYNIK